MPDTLKDEAHIRSILDDGAKALYAKDAEATVAHYAEDIVIAKDAATREAGLETRDAYLAQFQLD